MSSIVKWFSSDFNRQMSQRDETQLLILVTSEDGTEKYLKLNKPFTRNELSAALHYFADKLKEE
jgi:hypothetical protein